MRYIEILFLSIAFTLLLSCESQTNHEVKSFHISIIRNPTFAPATQWNVSEDSIMVSYTDFNTRQMMYYTRRWTEVEKQQMLAMISQWDLNSFDAKQMGDAPADATSFSFDAQIDGASFQKYTCLEKIDEFFQFAAYIDKSLPEEHRIGYNDSYFQQ